MAFVEEESGAVKMVNYSIDLLFFVDICVNFLSAYEKPNRKNEINLKQIVKTYLASWFIFDLIATFPLQLFIEQQAEGGTAYNRLARLTRLPRLYRLTRILSLMKVLKQLQYNKKLNRCFGSLNLKSTTKKLIKLSLTMFMIVHLSSCFWYLAAKLMLSDDTTWVSRKGTISEESSTMLLYFEAVYWST